MKNNINILFILKIQGYTFIAKYEVTFKKYKQKYHRQILKLLKTARKVFKSLNWTNNTF